MPRSPPGETEEREVWVHPGPGASSADGPSWQKNIFTNHVRSRKSPGLAGGCAECLQLRKVEPGTGVSGRGPNKLSLT